MGPSHHIAPALDEAAELVTPNKSLKPRESDGSEYEGENYK
jgi:hypothetical protein